MIVVYMSLAKGVVVRLDDLRHGQSVTLVARNRHHARWVLTVHDNRLESSSRRPHDWVEAFDAQGRMIHIHINEDYLVDRISIHERRHPKAKPQLDLFAS